MSNLFKGKCVTNVYVATVYRVFIGLVILQLSRLGYFLYNQEYFPKTDLLTYLKLASGGIVFDIAAFCYVNAIFILLSILPFPFRSGRRYQIIVKISYLISNAIFLLLNTMDTVYYDFVKRRSTAVIFDEFKGDTNLLKVIFVSILQYWYLTLLLVLLIFLMMYLYNRVKVSNVYNTTVRKYYTTSSIVFLLGIGLFIAGTRGGFHGNRPIKIDEADEYIINRGEEAIVLNTMFSLLLTKGESSLVEYDFFTNDEIVDIYSPIHYPKKNVEFRDKNVVLIVLESFGKEYIGALNRDSDISDYKGYTPFLDSLIGESLYFKYGFANGDKSVKATASIVSSIISTSNAFSLSSYSQNSYESIASLLKNKGYKSTFYHGAQHGSLGISSYANKVGFDKYVGKEQHPNPSDDDGVWGIWDEPFMQFVVDDISVDQGPFLAYVYTLTSHHPFRVPKQYDNTFDKGHLPIHKTIGYTDNALRKFFAKAKETSWYDNTLFVITSDHTNQKYYEQYKKLPNTYAVPILFYTPDGELKGERLDNVQQIDILPSILDYLNYDMPYFAYGKSVLYKDSGSDFVVLYDNGYIAVYKDYMLSFDGVKSVSLYDYKKDCNLQNYLLGQELDVVVEIENKLKAFLQTYNHTLIHNKMNINSFSLAAK